MSNPALQPLAQLDQVAIEALVEDDMRAVDKEISRRLQSDVVLINQLASYIISSGGKRLRPLIVLLSGKALDYQGHSHILLATIIEFIHTATLLHDDVVDASEMRRGKFSANTVWGNEASVLVGDFLYSRAFEMMVDAKSMRVMEILSKTTNTIAEGEVLQLMNCHNPNVSESDYIKVIQNKTAKLFEASTQLGAIITGQPQNIELAMAAYGMHLGTAFQLIDDALDYGKDNDHLDKNVGDDLAEGKPTLPLIHAMREGDTVQKGIIREAIEKGGLDSIDTVLDTIEATNSIHYTIDQARKEATLAREALKDIPDSIYRQALVQLTYLSVNRDH